MDNTTEEKKRPEEDRNKLQGRPGRVVRILLSPDVYSKLQAYAEKHRFSISRGIRDALKDNQEETLELVKHMVETTDPRLQVERLPKEEAKTGHKSFAFYLTENAYQMLKYFEARLYNVIPGRGKTTYILRAIIADLLDKEEHPKPKRGRPRKAIPSPQRVKETRPEPEDGSRKKRLADDVKTNFTFKVREYFRDGVETTKAVADLSKKDDISISEVYVRALERFIARKGTIIPEPPSVAKKQVIVRLLYKHQKQAEALAKGITDDKKKLRFDLVAVSNATWYTQEQKDAILARAGGRLECNTADIFRSAIYEELALELDKQEDK